MKWISATNLQEWTIRTNARALLIDMVGDLIRASHPKMTYFRFPGEDKAQVRGFDGDLEADIQTSFIPAGKSKWEFGIGKGKEKATSDFNKRDSQTESNVKNENTLVLVNLNTWDSSNRKNKISDFVDGLKKTSEWKDILFIDGAQLETWLQIHPAVAANYARKYLRLVPLLGAISTDEYWDSFCTRFNPPVTEQVLTCEQDQITGVLKEHLLLPSGMLQIGAETPEDLVAFSVASIRTLPADVRLFIEARTLIVETREAARQLANLEGLVLILKNDAVYEAGMLSKTSRVIMSANGTQGRGVKHKLTRPTSSGFGRALESMDIEEERAYTLARKSGRSLTILQRLIPFGIADEPKWKDHSQKLIPAVLAGGWSTDSDLDKEVLKSLSTLSTYDDFETSIRPLLSMEDPPIDKVNDVWVTRSQADAFNFIHPYFGKKEQDLFKQSVIKVLGAETPKPDPNAPFNRFPDRENTYSDWLKDGLANMLLQIVSISQDAGFTISGSSSNQAYVDSIIQLLPGWGKRHETIIAITEQLNTIAEASPNSFLNALESLLEGDSNEILALFTDSDKSFFARTSPHTYILWALELLAWDSKNLIRSCEVLTKIASIDPGGSTTNRPINSLREILLTWSPNTYASCNQRLECLDHVIQIDPQVGWQLLVSLLPSKHDTSSPTQKPRLKDVSPRVPEVLTYALVWKAQAHVVNRAIDLGAKDEDRLLTLIKHISDFAPEERNRTLSAIDQFLADNNTPEGNPVWVTLRDEVRRQEFFKSAEWALNASELSDFKAIVIKHEPKDPMTKFTWLFDDWMPYVGEYQDKTETKTDQTRIEAIYSIYEQKSVQGIFELISKVKLKHIVLQTASNCNFNFDFYNKLLDLLLSEHEPDKESISVLSAIGSNKFGDDWANYVSEILSSQTIPDELRLPLFINWENNQKTWTFIEKLGPADEVEYWTSINVLPLAGNKEDLDKAIQRFIDFGKSVQVIYTLYNRIEAVETETLFKVLCTAIHDINHNPGLINHMFSYNVEKIFKSIRSRPELQLQLEVIARLEYAYINVLDHDVKDLSIHRFVIENPKFYMELICDVFVGDDEEPLIGTQSTKSKATASFHVLNSLKMLPGQNQEGIDFDFLESWINQVRSLAIKFKRIDITDKYIGHILAHSPIDNSDQVWPHISVRKVIENFRNNWIEDGIAIERFNMRGVFSRGLYEGGTQEMSIAESYLKWADLMNGFPRTKSLLERLHDEWISHAGVADERAEKRKLKS